MNINSSIKNTINYINEIINEAVKTKESVLYCKNLFNEMIKGQLNTSISSDEGLQEKIRALDSTKYTHLLEKANQLSQDIITSKCTDYPSSLKLYLNAVEFNDTLNEIYKE